MTGSDESRSGDDAAPLPPGQRAQTQWPVLHYGPVPRFKPERWDLQVYGATADGAKHSWDYGEFHTLPTAEVLADMHCVTKFSLVGNTWSGVLARTVLDLAPPAPDATHAMIWAEYGYSANLRIEDLRADATIFATHRGGVELTPDHGFPLRLVVPHLYAWKGPKWVRAVEYLSADRRGFWEERGYHNTGDPWQEQRYSYQED
ncbi:MAG TPA: molybdopterin-dependent oxidoreductase [Actinospica sp.]|jgi:DMSO/TMAO reductase YedYZ molybdopterin-dependent catalytic subunit|nr:molybdopterin-dependent oxidoreductase [Actinospica sp.]